MSRSLWTVTDGDGVTVREALESIGYLGSDPAPSLDALAAIAEGAGQDELAELADRLVETARAAERLR